MVAEFRVLGDVEVHIDGQLVDVGPARRRCVLAALLIDVNRTVHPDQLVDRVWGNRPPHRARGALSSYLTRLKQVLSPAQDVHLGRRSGGYVLSAEAQEVDLHRFRQLLVQARDVDTDERTAALLEESLGLWEGRPFTGLDTPWFNLVRDNLVAERQAAEHDLTDVRLRLGQHGRLLAPLARRMEEQPLDERLAGQLMLALYFSGRQADALETYSRVRLRLAEELGVDPSPPLQAVYHQVLSADFRPASPPARTEVPRQLPSAPVEFTGRTKELAWLNESVDAGANAMVISALSGTGGIGKTALALHWAHRVAADLPDGQLHVNLRGHALVPPMEPAEALARFLRALGVPEKQIPIDADERAAAYRSLVAGRRMLVVLDDAASADQVRPLLPGTATCVVLITSRTDLRGLTALDGAKRIVLNALGPDEARALLGRAVGEARTRAEPAAVSRLVQLCGRLPLALRIAAGQLERYPRSPIADYVAQLDDGDLLTRLSIPGDSRAAVRASFDLSYRKLTPESARLFRLLGLAPMPDLTSHAAAALSDIPLARATALLDQLSAVHLVESSAPDRFHLHDLLRLYATERAHQEDVALGCTAAIRRLHAFYLRTVDAAARLIYPDQSSLLDDAGPAPAPFAAKADALAWMDAERAGVVAVVRHAAERGELRTCWQLSHAAGAYFFVKMDLTDWWETIRVGLDAAERAGDVRGRIALLSSQALFSFTVADYDRALDCGEQALQLIGRSGGYPDEATIIRMRGMLCWLVGRLDDAVGHFDRAARHYQRDGNPVGEAHARIGLAAVSDDRGNWDDALDHAGAALELGTRADSPVSVGLALHSTAGFLGRVGRFSEAIDLLPEILAVYRAANAVYHEPSWYQISATIYRDLGDLARARADAEKAVQLARAIEEKRTEAHSLNVLGTIAALTGQAGDALELHETAQRLATRLQLRKAQIDANIGRTAALPPLGRPQEALLAGDTALAIAREHGYVHCEGGALLAIAGVYLATGRPDLAADHAEQALTIHRRTGHRLGEARALRTLGQIAADRHEPTATQHRAAALQILDELGCAGEADELRSLADLPARTSEH